ncbi:MAG TPA: DUF2085 domain-containing protein [Candidatus Limnocylindrales bacterium]|nr:DUF2085 domain-containing protein [Candidatus Limnocylindrales bacterium]
MTPLHDIFSLVCGQQHNSVVGGMELPFCQRCTGLYVGVVPALLVYLLCKPKPTARMLWVHGIFLLLMVPFGYHLVVQTGEIRMLTGQLFACGLVYYLTLLLSDRWASWRKLLPLGDASYFALLALSLLLLQIAVIWGGKRTNAILSWLGFGGLLLYALLVLVNLAFLAEAAWNALRRRAHYSES